MKEGAIVLLGSVAVMCAVIVFIVVHTTPRHVSQKVVLLGLDGLGAQNLKQAFTPHLDSMHYQEAHVDPNSVLSGPNWVKRLTGYDSDITGIYNNTCKLPKRKTLFDEYPSAVYTQWDTIKCYSDNIARYAYKYFTADELFDTVLLNDTLHGNESFVFVHIDVLDYYSHAVGSEHDAFVDALEKLDRTLLPLIMPYDLVVTGDHGSKRGGIGHSRDKVPVLTHDATSHGKVYDIVREKLGW